jgi:hypothetical protein
MDDHGAPRSSVLGRGVGYGAASGAALGLLVMGTLAAMSTVGADPAPELEVVALALSAAVGIGLVAGTVVGLVLAGVATAVAARRGTTSARAATTLGAGLGALLVTALALGLERPSGELPAFLGVVLTAAVAAAALAWLLTPALLRLPPRRG